MLTAPLDFEPDDTGMVLFMPIRFVGGIARRYEIDWIDPDFDIDKNPDWWDMPF
jgi:hypothetical protein